MQLRRPDVAAVAVAALIVGGHLLWGALASAALVLLLVTTLVVAVRGARWWLVLVADGVVYLVLDPHATQIGDLTFSGGLLALTYLVGWAVWSRKHRVTTLELEAQEAAAQHEARVAQTVAAEREAMAVDLHDIVTHAVSAIVVQAQAGRRGSAEVAQSALAAIEDTARTAVTELRRLLLVLGSPPVAPARAADRRRARLRAAGPAVAIVVLGELELWSGERYNGSLVWPGPSWFSAVLILALAAPLLVRRSRPELMAATVFGLLAAEGLLVGSTEAATGPVLVVTAAFCAAARGARWRVVVPAAALQCTVFAITDRHAQGVIDRFWLFGLAALGLGLGHVAHRRQRRIGVLEQDAEVSAREHEQRVAEALAAERTALAHELHDIVSHAVSVIVIQAQVGARDPGAALQCLAAIEDAARTALVELRRLLVLLAPADARGEVRPTASLLQLDELLLRWRAAGLQIELDTHDLPPLPPAIDLAAYRVVQESLTNTAKHAPGARVRITLAVAGDQLEVSTRDSGAVGPAAVDGVAVDGVAGAGRGLIGMRQRVELVGGTLLEAGQRDDGFVVHARLPVAVAS